MDIQEHVNWWPIVSMGLVILLLALLNPYFVYKISGGKHIREDKVNWKQMYAFSITIHAAIGLVALMFMYGNESRRVNCINNHGEYILLDSYVCIKKDRLEEVKQMLDFIEKSKI